jgi:hypothetical protein
MTNVTDACMSRWGCTISLDPPSHSRKWTVLDPDTTGNTCSYNKDMFQLLLFVPEDSTTFRDVDIFLVKFVPKVNAI